MDTGIIQANRQAPVSPIPVGWLGRANAPAVRPDWAVIGQLNSIQHRNLLAQMGYSLSGWDYEKVGTNNELGRYQIDVPTLEQYGLLMSGSYDNYGIGAVNYQHCWRSAGNTYAEYLSDVASLQSFLFNTIAQEQLAYQILSDLYTESIRINTIRLNDSAEVVAGMLYVAWELGVGTTPTSTNASGTGSYAWRFSNIGNGAGYYNAGRYAIAVLSK